jgi:hypothetical protein
MEPETRNNFYSHYSPSVLLADNNFFKRYQNSIIRGFGHPDSEVRQDTYNLKNYRYKHSSERGVNENEFFKNIYGSNMGEKLIGKHINRSPIKSYDAYKNIQRENLKHGPTDFDPEWDRRESREYQKFREFNDIQKKHISNYKKYNIPHSEYIPPQWPGKGKTNEEYYDKLYDYYGNIYDEADRKYMELRNKQ